MLVRELGKYAYAEARLMQNRAKSVQERRRWRDVALAVAGKTGRQVGLDTATRMAQGAELHQPRRASVRESEPPVDPIEEDAAQPMVEFGPAINALEPK